MAVVALADVSACSSAVQPGKAEHAGRKVLRVLYRDHKVLMLVTLPAKPGDPPVPSDCATPLLIDPASGAAKAITASEMSRRLKSMQLAAATRGTCDAAKDTLRRK